VNQFKVLYSKFNVFLKRLNPWILESCNFYEHDEQLEDPHVAQEEPLPLDDVNLCPTENPKADIFL
jgi:hypothetical protein